MSSTTDTLHYLSREQLRLGHFIVLEQGWLSHPFALNRFLISNQDQLDTLRGLNLPRYAVDPALSQPDPSTTAASSPPAAAATDTSDTVASPDRKATSPPDAEQLRQQARMDQLRACEKAFGAAARVVHQVQRQAEARPIECAEHAIILVDQMLDELLTEQDIALQLMNDQGGPEDIYLHPLNVSVLALLLGRAMQLDRDSLRKLALAAVFHDLGKLRLPDRVLLLREGEHNQAERKLLAEHCGWSTELAARAGLPREVCQIIMQHHEHADGSGYPLKLKLEQIHPLSRVLVVVNHYDNLCNRAHPTDTQTPHEALAQMFAQQRQRFDPAVLASFVRCMGVYPPGTLVELSDHRLGVVVSVNTSRPLRPDVMVHEPGSQRTRLVELELREQLNISRSLKSAMLPRDSARVLQLRRHTSYFFRPCEPA